MKKYSMRFSCFLFVLIFLGVMVSSCSDKPGKDESGSERIELVRQQLTPLVELALEQQEIPRTVHDGKLKFAGKRFDWTEGFFPGTCWYMFELTGDEFWKNAALELQELYVDHRFRTTNHDLGFVFNCSFGNGYRLFKDEKSKQVLMDAANSLITRFNPNVGCIKSWDVDRGWQAERGWQFPVIIDNMMNLELLFEVSKLTGDPKYKDIAIQHARTTIKNHFRKDGSSYHVIDYDTLTGEIRNRHTAQGFAHESAWARGQAWGLYGFTVCYQYTKDEQFLRHAEMIARFILDHPNLPEDMVPYWDFDATDIPNVLRDASAAAIIASALLQLDEFSDVDFQTPAKAIFSSLSSEEYFAPIGENHQFLIKHCVGSIPHGNEIDVPLNYADYYYTETLYRLKKLDK